MEEEKEEKKGFRVIDKRFTAEEGEKKREKKKEIKEERREERKQEEKREEKEEIPPLPEVTFSTFVYSLSTSVLIHLGEIPEPTTQKMAKNIPLAKQTIDILGILQEKTKGNLNQDEENLLSSLLYDLRMRYVKVTG
ncbi:MAG: DUF1844 domain-containing protein [Deltaproteobacteria bacterium]|nr:DUF1844 domain-containing protein [Deltaproteobacteria bacterium]